MKKIDRFLSAELNEKGLQNLFGGAKPIETCHQGQCDVHHDENDNGVLDAGECIEFVECENK